jgi:hypothetical protein
MFGWWGTTKFEDVRVQTPDGPGVIKGMHKGMVHVKLTKSPGRPRHYKKTDVRQIDTSTAEELGGFAVKFVPGAEFIPDADKGVKVVLGGIFKRMFKSKTGY